tara:strand:- start:423 stop:905 length:483 start_codon:yes stop_codon:yes gene_type:complete
MIAGHIFYKEYAIFAAGCFWGPQEVFDNTKGVVSTKVGYIGGITSNPTYQEVCTGKTGHAEAVEIYYNNGEITYEKLLQIFWKCHDPTTLNRQGLDIGNQYRSSIFYLNEDQKIRALASKKAQSKDFNNPIVTDIVKAGKFYTAEEYHQKYIKKNNDKRF